MINVLFLLITILNTIETYNRLIFNNTIGIGGPVFKYYNVAFLKVHLLAKNSKYNILFFVSKCCERRPRIDINCVFVVWQIIICLISVMLTILYFAFNRLQLFLILNICSFVGALTIALFSEQHLDSLLKKTRLIEEPMTETEWLIIRKEIEEEWPGFFEQ